MLPREPVTRRQQMRQWLRLLPGPNPERDPVVDDGEAWLPRPSALEAGEPVEWPREESLSAALHRPSVAHQPEELRQVRPHRVPQQVLLEQTWVQRESREEAALPHLNLGLQALPASGLVEVEAMPRMPRLQQKQISCCSHQSCRD